MIGLTVANYKINSKLGEGGMGSVYLGVHKTLQRKVAIKVLQPEFITNSDLKERFINEAKILSKLNHHNIVSLYDFVEFQGNLLIIMELAEGKNLDTLIKEVSFIPVERAIYLFKQLLTGVAYAHQQGIIHRDIKPSNIIIAENDIPKILDFGISKIIHGDLKLTKTGMRIGSVAYMSPEQILGKEITIMTDIYSLGITLFEMLSGKLPFDIDTLSEFEIQNKIVTEEFIFNSNINNVPSNIINILNKATSKNPYDRFLSCEEFIRAFDDNNFRNEVKTGRTTFIENKFPDLNNETSKNINKKKTSLIISATAIILIFIAIIVIYTLNTEENVKVVNQKSVSNTGETNTARIKEKENVIKIIENKLQQWNTSNENRSRTIGEYYSNNVDFYTVRNKSRNYVVSQKNSFFNKWQNITLTISNLTTEKISENEYVCVFDKEFNVSNNNGKIYRGKVKSRIIFENEGGDWLIVSETDDKTYWTDKNY